MSCLLELKKKKTHPINTTNLNTLHLKSGVPTPFFLCHELMVVMTVYHWSCRNTLEARSPMPSDMAQGEGLEPMNGLCGEAAGESCLSLLSNPA